MSLSWPILRVLIFSLGFGSLIFFYAGMRFSPFPASHLTLVLIPTGIVSFIIMSSAINLNKNEGLVLVAILLMLLVTGAFVYTPYGIALSPGAIAAALVIVCAYLLARALTTLDLAYYFSAAAFWIVAIPALWTILNGSPIVLRDFFVGASENVVSSWLIITSSAMASAKYRRNGCFSFIPFMITAVVAYFLFTRASVVVAFLALAFMVYSRFGVKRIVFLVLFIGGGVLWNFHMFYDLFSSAIDQTKFGSSGLESPRWMMWYAYFREMNGLSLLFGTDVSFIPEIHEYSNNPHSSIIRFHSMFGLVSMIVGVVIIFSLFFSSGFLYTFMLLVILLRAVTDTLLFGVFFDVFLMIVVINAFETGSHFLNLQDVSVRRLSSVRPSRVGCL